MLLHSQFEHDCVSKTAGQAMKESLQNKIDDFPARHNSHLSCLHSGGQRSSVLMMMCQIGMMTSDGHVTRARALHDCALSTSFVTESMDLKKVQKQGREEKQQED